MIHIHHPIHIIQTKKFKTISVLVCFIGKFNQSTLTKRELLCRLLDITTKNYPTKKALTQKMYELYNASIIVSNFSLYETNVTYCCLKCVAPQYVDEPRLLEEAMQLMNEIISHPNITKDGFDTQEFYEEKQKMINRIDGLYNNKSRYATQRLFEEMAPDELISLPEYGTKEEINILTPQDILCEYQEMMQEERLAYVLGDVDKQQIKSFFIHQPQKDFPKYRFYPISIPKVDKVKEIFEEQDIHQTIVLMGYRMDVHHNNPQMIPMMVFNAMFGGMAVSDLFATIRETHGLAYNIYSTVNYSHQVFVVKAGINAQEYPKVKQLVQEILMRYQQGVIDSTLLNKAKQSLISSFKENKDETLSYIVFLLRQHLLQEGTIDTLISKINEVTLNDIKNASLTLTLDTIFCLRGNHHE